MARLTIERAAVEGKRVLVRVDFNVPLEDGRVADDTRIRRSLPTVRHLLDRGARPILVSHLGRPKGVPVDALRMGPVAERVAELLERPVGMAPGAVGPEVLAMVDGLGEGDVLLLENVRFYPGETADDDGFARGLAELCDLFVQDAFGTCHRAHASVVGVPRHRTAAAGLLLKKELQYVDCLFDSGETPFVCILGGAKVADKIPIIESLVEAVDVFLIGGAMAYTFLAARGEEVGRSLVETESLDVARRVLDSVAAAGGRILLPVDHVVASSIDDEAGAETVESIPADRMGLDIGPRTGSLFEEELTRARMVVLNGPMGVFERPAFSLGTKRIIRNMAASEGVTVVGGGDSARAVETFGAADKVSHISTGGGAFLEILGRRTLPGIEALSEA